MVAFNLALNSRNTDSARINNLLFQVQILLLSIFYQYKCVKKLNRKFQKEEQEEVIKNNI